MQSSAETNYLVIRRHKTFGPFTASQLRQFASSDRLRLDDLVRRLGRRSQSYVENIASLRILFKSGHLEREVVVHGDIKIDSLASHKAIQAYRAWKGCGPAQNLTQATQKTPKTSMPFRTEELLRQGEFDLTVLPQ